MQRSETGAEGWAAPAQHDSVEGLGQPRQKTDSLLRVLCDAYREAVVQPREHTPTTPTLFAAAGLSRSLPPNSQGW